MKRHKKLPSRTGQRKTDGRVFAEHVVDLLGELGEVRARAMFGGFGIYCDDVVIGIIADGTLYLKADPESQSEFERAGSKPFQYRRKGRPAPVTMSYWEAPAESLDSAATLTPWAELAQQAAQRAAKPKRRAAKPKRKGSKAARTSKR
jgi:DNA transformation protein